MKKIVIVFLALLTLAAFTIGDPLKIGDVMPSSNSKMQVVSGKEISLKEASGQNGLLVMFSCNTCPFVVKNQQPIVKSDPTLNLKMDQLEDQLKKINEYLMNNNPKNPKIIKNVIPDLPKEVTIINESEDNGNNGNNGDEYEEIEVTDDEADE